jgi:alpha-L-fucosidase
MLLTVGPRPDGTIPAPEVAMLEEIGAWLRPNAEAIYGTRPWAVYGEGPTQVVGGSFHDTDRTGFTGADIRFTTKGDALYAIALGRPEGGRIAIKALAEGSAHHPGAIGSVTLLDGNVPLEWKRTAAGLAVELPAGLPDAAAYTLKIV